MPRKKPKLKAQQLHRDRLKQIRKFVDFDYDLRRPLSENAIRKIRRYHAEITALTNRPYQVFRPRSADHLAEAQEFAQHENRLPGLKVAFIPTDGANKVRLRFTKRGVVGSTKHVITRHIPLSVRELLIDPIAHVNARIAGNPAKQFTVQAGRYEIPQGYTKTSIARAVGRLCNIYGESGGVTQENNHHFKRWLHGLNAYTFEEQGDIAEYLETKQKSIQAGKRRRRNARKKRQRLRENT